MKKILLLLAVLTLHASSHAVVTNSIASRTLISSNAAAADATFIYSGGTTKKITVQKLVDSIGALGLTLTNSPATNGPLFAPNFNFPEVEYVMTNNVAFTNATGGAAGLVKFSTIYFYNGAATNREIVLQPAWTLFGCTITNTAITNRWTAVHFRCSGTDQTNVFARLDAQ